MAVIHYCYTLRADHARDGIEIEADQILFKPRWGGRVQGQLLAACHGVVGLAGEVCVAVTSSGIVLSPCVGGHAERELVLAEIYSPGCGAKRWPSFDITFGPEVRVLASAGTQGGSGGERWTLLSAPLGWSANIASQFVNERDEPDQVISFAE